MEVNAQELPEAARRIAELERSLAAAEAARDAEAEARAIAEAARDAAEAARDAEAEARAIAEAARDAEAEARAIAEAARDAEAEARAIAEAATREQMDSLVASSIAILISNDTLPPGAADADRATMSRILNDKGLITPPMAWISSPRPHPELLSALRTVLNGCRD
ncbi:hypothetical protein TSOC_000510 [Tetrabaena socialis]|uniref:Uncharacterized protein n=1 Tax=Tetrabaena socialis TaxID=47790 RepID=A0A2J8AJ73_9CHLO|nr:hypothetical protein TSOC_000510 [Tetrabaena socialis]|eukprot:PNH12576.1 hypothetical protein TSOC_000510 [Tetrabaena socialis]